MLEIILKWLIPTILTLLLGYITKEIRENRRNNHTMKNSMIILLRSQITGKIETYINLGYLPDYARTCLEELFKQYESLGGNHGIKELVDQCFKLPPIKVEKR